ncbi:MAG: class A sortase [Aerococcaceae bacterium]|nr:class A sortase [Aerococcaceae bacterium]
MTKKKRKKRSLGTKIRLTLAVLLLLFGLALLAIDPIKHHMIKRAQEVNSIGQLTREQIIANEQREVTYNFEDIKELNAVNVLKNNVNPKDLPTIGAVAIPSVNMNLPIYKGVSDEGMYLGAGTLLDKQKMGKSNYSLASHHSIHKGLLFEPLVHVKVGDYVYLTDLDKIYKYKVFFYELVDPSRVDLIEPTEEAIVTLITCDSTLVNRIVVQGKLEEIVPVGEASDEMLAAFQLAQTVPNQ